MLHCKNQFQIALLGLCLAIATENVFGEVTYPFAEGK
jgi:hypothetical protein